MKIVQIVKESEGLFWTIVCPGLPTDQIEVINKTLEVVNEKSHYPEKWTATVVSYPDPTDKK